jgi:RNA polymerase sporulation-specific sigma factor
MNDARVLEKDDIAAAKKGDEAAFARIERRYRTLLRHFAKRYFAPGMTRDDLMQEARFGLLKAVRDFDPAAKVQFNTFAALCVHRQIITAVKAATRQKHGVLNESVPVLPENDPERSEWRPTLKDDPAQVLIERERLGELLRSLKWDCTPLEAQAIWLVEAEGLRYDEACGILGCGEKMLDNALQRARRKLGVVEARGSFCAICQKPDETGKKHCADCEAELEASRAFLASA